MYVVEFAGEDDVFAAGELENAATGITVISPGLATVDSLERDTFQQLAFARRASIRLAETAGTVPAARQALAGVAFEKRGTAAVRARAVRGTADIDTQQAEIELGRVLSEAGFAIDLENPDHELLALFADDSCFLGWTVVKSRRNYGERLPTDRPFFQPGSMSPMLARAVINLAGVHAGDTVIDPMCGTGGLLLEAGLVGATPVGFDAQKKMVEGTQTNLAAVLETGGHVGLADATTLPIPSKSVGAVVFDAPYGRQSKIAIHSLDALIEGTLDEARRVGDQAVMVADRDWTAAANEAGWRVRYVFERRVHRSLTRFVHVLA